MLSKRQQCETKSKTAKWVFDLEQSKKKKGKEEEPYTLRAEGAESPEPAACFWMTQGGNGAWSDGLKFIFY